MSRVPFAFEASTKPPRDGAKFALRFWSNTHSRGMEKTYAVLEKVLRFAAPLFKAIGYERMEKPMVAIEKTIKGALFDCRMCGQCILSSTGMSCPMNCPKNLRNGPCGGVRANGNCEVYAEMPCVWVQAWEGSKAMEHGNKIMNVQPAIDHRLKGRSSWLAVSRGAHE